MNLEEQSMIRRQQVNDYPASGQTATAWCSENNMLNKVNREAKADPKQEIFIEFKQPSAKEVPVIIKIGAVSIELYAGFQAETLREAIATPQ